MKTKLCGVEVLRFLTAVWVVSFHALPHYDAINAVDIGFFRGFIELGYFGVDVFFVLSGYVLARSYFSEKISPPKFLEVVLDRLIKIYVPYWIVFIATITVLPWLGWPELRNKEIVNSVFLATNVGNLLVIPPVWF
ncbi:MAG: acyltransferase [Uliginosibacterium sp.]|nr:acyltransferase [Uliginosibacterium sp.]